jgi:hypothetical protein
MVDGDEEVDTILLEFNVSVCCLFVCVGAFGFLDLQKTVRSGPRGQKLSGNLGE